MPLQSSRQPMSPARRAAYRRLALTVLGLDVQALATGLRTRRDQREATPRSLLVRPMLRAA
jgi:hypothetical protein